ncbi:hypothetical protein NSQ54_08015 [Alkalihalobacillus sp. FSL W8-0930]
MQVNPLLSGNVVATEKPLKQGEVLRGATFQPISDTEATINVRGKELTVKVDGKMPTSNQANFIVTSVDEDGIRVQEWSPKEATHAPKLGTGSQALLDANDSLSNEAVRNTRGSLMEAAIKSGISRPTGLLLDAMTLVQESGRPLSEETIRELSNFLKSSSEKPKLQAVEALLSKNLPIRESHLQAIHETRTGKPLNDIVKSLEQQVQPKQQEINHLKQQVLKQLVQSTSGKQLSDVQQALVKEFQSQLSQAITVDKIDQLSQLISKTLQGDKGIQGKAEQPKLVEPLDTLNLKKESLVALPKQRESIEGSSRQKESVEVLPKQKESAEPSLSQKERVHTSLKQKEPSQQVTRLVELDEPTQLRAKSSKEDISMFDRSRNGIDNLSSPIKKEVDHQIPNHRTEGNSSESEKHPLQQVVRSSNVELPLQKELPLQEPEEAKVVVQRQRDHLNQLAQTIELEENPHKALEAIKSDLQGQPVLEHDQVNRLMDQLEVSGARLQAGRELAARTVLSTAIEAELSMLPSSTDSLPEELNNRLMQNEYIAPIQSKQIIVTTVTDKMAQLTNEFKDFQRETVRTLRQIQVDLTTPQRSDMHVSKNQLDSIIRKLDHSILRGEAMQFADMKTEKHLMLASSKLAEARQHLAAGRNQQAADIVTKVQKQVEAITYKPSETKVVAESARQQLNHEQKKPQSTPLFHMEEAAAKAKSGTARGAFEALKQLGLNHEADFAQKFSQKEPQKEVPLERNLKQSLIQLVNSQDEGSKTTQLASQALQHVTGQQLLSKQDAQPLQSLFFQLPLVLEQKVEQLQCYIQSKKEGEQVDWQNCSLYFLMETPKLGEVGISIKAVQRQLSVTLTNDQKDFKSKMEPLVEKAIAKVEEVGYSISSVSFSPFTKNQETESIQTPKNQVYSSDKGFDYKI